MLIKLNEYLNKFHMFIINNDILIQSNITKKCKEIKEKGTKNLLESLLFYYTECFCDEMRLDYSQPFIDKESIDFKNKLNDLFDDESIDWNTITKQEMQNKISA